MSTDAPVGIEVEVMVMTLGLTERAAKMRMKWMNPLRMR